MDFGSFQDILTIFELQLDAVLVVGRPGAEGGVATASMVFGLTEPSGRFAASWPRTVVWL
jgi:beta-glucosidase